MPEESKGLPLVADVERVLGDLRGMIDDTLLQLKLGEKDVKDLLAPVIERASNAVAEIKSRL